MIYKIKTITDYEQLEECPLFYVNNFNWGGEYRPKTHGQLAFVKNEGFLLNMTCEESDPVCTYFNMNDPVYLDSAMEAFFMFHTDSDNYINFEVNSAGAMIARFGASRNDRTSLTPEEMAACNCTATVREHTWSVELFIPLSIIGKYFNIASFAPKDKIRCNFYKIAEGSVDTHFASYTPIHYPEPNFHLTQFFADGVIED